MYGEQKAMHSDHAITTLLLTLPITLPRAAAPLMFSLLPMPTLLPR